MNLPHTNTVIIVSRCQEYPWLLAPASSCHGGQFGRTRTLDTHLARSRLSGLRHTRLPLTYCASWLHTMTTTQLRPHGLHKEISQKFSWWFISESKFYDQWPISLMIFTCDSKLMEFSLSPDPDCNKLTIIKSSALSSNFCTCQWVSARKT